MGNNSRWKHKFLVNYGFQFRYSVIVASISSVIFAILGYKFYQSEMAKQRILKIQYPAVEDLVQAQDDRVLYYLVGFFLVQILSIVFLGLILTHRIAGPMFRVQKTLEESIEKKEVLPIRPIRKNDEFQGFFDTLQKFIETFITKKDQR